MRYPVKQTLCDFRFHFLQSLNRSRNSFVVIEKTQKTMSIDGVHIDRKKILLSLRERPYTYYLVGVLSWSNQGLLEYSSPWSNIGKNMLT